ncbi:MAG: flagellar protein FlaG [Magnetococcales bacterium]|nr:flagellar protein FlaG [Magnetococcales bacterium]
METIAAYGMSTVPIEPVVVGKRVEPEHSAPGGGCPGDFDAQLAQAELAFWGDQLGTTQPGLKNLAAEITHTLSGLKSLHLSMDEERQHVVVRVVDRGTSKVLRQLPNQQMVDLVQQMRDLEGLLFKASS